MPGCKMFFIGISSRIYTQMYAISTHQGVVDKLVDINGGLQQLPGHPAPYGRTQSAPRSSFLLGREAGKVLQEISPGSRLLLTVRNLAWPCMSLEESRKESILSRWKL